MVRKRKIRLYRVCKKIRGEPMPRDNHLAISAKDWDRIFGKKKEEKKEEHD